MSAFQVCLWVFAGVCGVCWVLSVTTRECSWVDRAWSLVPVAYVGIFAGAAGFTDARLNVMFVLVALRGARLTFNFARKGGYARDSEDYRTKALHGKCKPCQVQVHNLFFITFFQNAILLLTTLPAWTALEHRGSFGALDVVLAVVFLTFLAGETVADQQQWDFQQRKQAERAAGREPDPRFLQAGLFRFSRHPNLFFEQAQWWVVALSGVRAIPAQDAAAGAVVPEEDAASSTASGHERAGSLTNSARSATKNTYVQMAYASLVCVDPPGRCRRRQQEKAIRERSPA